MGTYDPRTLEVPLKRRLHAVIDKLVADIVGGGPLPWLIQMFAARVLLMLSAPGSLKAFGRSLWIPGSCGFSGSAVWTELRPLD